MTDNMLSKVEQIKTESRYLRGTIVEALEDPVTGDVGEADYQLLKFHGSYRQDDRDLRIERQRQKLEPDFQYMVRLRLPGGVISPEQWQALDTIAGDYGNGTLRLTTRQSIQLHGIRKSKLKPAIAAINESRLDTYAACGDVNRNVICGVNPAQSRVHEAVHAKAVSVSEALLPRSTAYREIWLDEEPTGKPDDEPVYGADYLPRKFKIAFAIPPFNDVDVLAHDIGLIAIVADDQITGYNLAVGGGMGMTYGEANTYPRLAEPIGFLTPDHVIAAALAVVGIQHEYGNRSDRKRARLKYTIESRGLDWFQQELHRRLGFELPAPRPYRFEYRGDRFGWTEDRDGHWHLTLALPSGRIAANWRTGLRAISECHGGEFRLTPNQNLTLAGIPARQKNEIESLVEDHGLHAYLRESALRRLSIACVALPTCGLAMAEAERYLPHLVDKLEQRLDHHGLLSVPLVLRVSGCPNGCARTYLGEIGLTGKAPGRYNLYLGGGFTGERLASLYRENVDETTILETLDQLFARYARDAESEEHFGDFVHRLGIVQANEFHVPAQR